MDMDISFEYYKTFYYVAKHGSLTKAAAELLRGQPNVTKTIHNLEEQLGCKLFVRTQRGVTLTPEGEKLYAHVAVAFRHLQAGEQEILLDRSLHHGEVKIASSEIALRCCLLPVLEQYRKAYPGVRIKLTNHSTGQAMDALRSGLADFAVVSAPFKVPDTLHCKQLQRVRLLPVCGKGYGSLEGRVLSLAELSAYPMVCMNPDTTTFGLLQNYFAENGLQLHPDIEVATADQLLPLIRSNLGFGFVPEGFWDDDNGFFVLKVAEQLPEQVVCLLKRKDAFLSIAAQKLEQMVMEHSRVSYK